MPKPTTTLEYVTEAAEDVRQARAEYRRTLLLAHQAGNTQAAIAAAAGVTPQAVSELLRRISQSVLATDRTEER